LKKLGFSEQHFIMTKEQTLTLIITFIVAVIMIILARKDHNSFKAGQHVNYQSIIVSLGILGTFTGIVWGLWNFNTQDVTASVPQLLEGLKLAFLTSILGMAISVFLSVLQAQPKRESDSSLLELKQQLEKANQTLFLILDEVKQFKTAYQRYQRENRFNKLNAEGQILPNTATEWVAIQDNETGLIWEVKTNDGGLQESQHTYTWYNPDAEIVGKENGGHCQGCRCDTAAYVEAINKMRLTGANNWRVPTIDELESLLKSIDKRYFPHIQPDWYCSSTPHSLENQFLCFYVETGQRGHNQFGYGHLILTR
jgi:hypothetical protein